MSGSYAPSESDGDKGPYHDDDPADECSGNIDWDPWSFASFPTFDGAITDGRDLLRCFLPSSSGNFNQGGSDTGLGLIHDIYFPTKYLRRSCNMLELWRALGREAANGGLIICTIFKPIVVLTPDSSGETHLAYDEACDFTRKDGDNDSWYSCEDLSTDEPSDATLQ